MNKYCGVCSYSGKICGARQTSIIKEEFKSSVEVVCENCAIAEKQEIPCTGKEVCSVIDSIFDEPYIVESLVRCTLNGKEVGIFEEPCEFFTISGV